MTSASELLAQARINHKRLPELPATIRPKTPGEAYAVQDGLIDQWLAHYGGGVIGYKVACTNVTAQRQLHVDAPFCGRLLSAFFFESSSGRPARVDASKFFMRVVEAEFAFEMARDLPPTTAPRSRDEIAAAVKGVLPGIEIVDSRFDDWTTIGAPSLIADNACNAAWVKGRSGYRLAVDRSCRAGRARDGERKTAARGHRQQCAGSSAERPGMAGQQFERSRPRFESGPIRHHRRDHGSLYGGARRSHHGRFRARWFGRSWNSFDLTRREMSRAVRRSGRRSYRAP